MQTFLQRDRLDLRLGQGGISARFFSLCRTNERFCALIQWCRNWMKASLTDIQQLSDEIKNSPVFTGAALGFCFETSAAETNKAHESVNRQGRFNHFRLEPLQVWSNPKKTVSPFFTGTNLSLCFTSEAFLGVTCSSVNKGYVDYLQVWRT